MDLVEFLLARINEEEALALAAIAVQKDPGWETTLQLPFGLWEIRPHVGVVHEAAQANHIAHWNPWRVLIDCNSRRGIVEECRDAIARGEAYWLASRVVLPLLARPYEQHPEFHQIVK